MNIITKLFLIINNLITGFVIINNPSYYSLQKQLMHPRILKNINMNDKYFIEKRENESIWFLHEYAIEKRLKELKELKDLNDYMNN